MNNQCRIMLTLSDDRTGGDNPAPQILMNVLCTHRLDLMTEA